jgi:hypothetical protein
MKFNSNTSSFEIKLIHNKGEWLSGILDKLRPAANPLMTYAKVKNSFEEQFDDFELFWQSKAMQKLRRNGLLLL